MSLHYPLVNRFHIQNYFHYHFLFLFVFELFLLLFFLYYFSNQYHSLFARFIWVCDLIPDLELPISGTTNLSLMIADCTEVGKVKITPDFNGASE